MISVRAINIIIRPHHRLSHR